MECGFYELNIEHNNKMAAQFKIWPKSRKGFKIADKELFQQRHQTDRQVNNRKSQVT